jgi:DNA-binding FadR family transcriptional regulator
MRMSFDWPRIYGALVSQGSRPPKSAFSAARQIENDIFEEGWPSGEVFGDQAHLIRRYGFSRATLREAVRLLEDRHVAHMRRGPGGGLIILPVPRAAIVPTIAEDFHASGIDATQIRTARTALRIIDTYRVSRAEGRDALRAFRNEFRGSLAQGSAAGLSDPARWCFAPAARAAGSHIFTDLFSACLDAIEDRTRTPNPAVELRPGLAHVLARKLLLELPRARIDGARRMGTQEQLCERHNVGREVLRQAVRVLESRGLIDSQRGRTHGLHACVSDSAALVELVVGYLSSARLRWSELEPVAQMLSRIVRILVTAESTPRQRQELLAKLDSMGDRVDAPALISAQLHSEWAMGANPLLIFMEQCMTAYCARSSAATWKCFDDSDFPPLPALQRYMMASARGDVVQVDRIIESTCARVSALRSGGVISAASEPQAASA